MTISWFLSFDMGKLCIALYFFRTSAKICKLYVMSASTLYVWSIWNPSFTFIPKTFSIQNTTILQMLSYMLVVAWLVHPSLWNRSHHFEGVFALLYDPQPLPLAPYVPTLHTLTLKDNDAHACCLTNHKCSNMQVLRFSRVFASGIVIFAWFGVQTSNHECADWWPLFPFKPTSSSTCCVKMHHYHLINYIHFNMTFLHIAHTTLVVWTFLILWNLNILETQYLVMTYFTQSSMC